MAAARSHFRSRVPFPSEDEEMASYEVGAGVPSDEDRKPFLRAVLRGEEAPPAKPPRDRGDREVFVYDRFARLDAGLPLLPASINTWDEQELAPERPADPTPAVPQETAGVIGPASSAEAPRTGARSTWQHLAPPVPEPIDEPIDEPALRTPSPAPNGPAENFAVNQVEADAEPDPDEPNAEERLSEERPQAPKLAETPDSAPAPEPKSLKLAVRDWVDDRIEELPLAAEAAPRRSAVPAVPDAPLFAPMVAPEPAENTKPTDSSRTVERPLAAERIAADPPRRPASPSSVGRPAGQASVRTPQPQESAPPRRRGIFRAFSS